MKIWIKIIFAIIIGVIIGNVFPDFTINQLENIFQDKNVFEFLTQLTINLLLYLSLLYILIRVFLSIFNVKKNKITARIFSLFILMVIASVFLSIVISIGVMNLRVFQPGNNFAQVEDQVIQYNAIDELLLKIVNGNIFSVFQGKAEFFLPVFFIALIFALGAHYAGKKSNYFVETIESLDHILAKIVRQLLEFFSIGAVFVMATFVRKSAFAPDNLQFITPILLAILLVSVILILIYTVLLFVFLKKGVFSFYLAILGALLSSFVTGKTSCALIPLTEHLKNNVGVKDDVADILGPIGLIINRSGTVMISSILLMSLIMIYTPDILSLELQLAFLLMIFLYSFFLDGTGDKGFLIIIAMILNFPSLHLEQDSYLLFVASIPVFSRIAVLIDTLSSAVFITITSKLTNCLEERRYLDYI